MNHRWMGVKSRIVSDVVEQIRAKVMLPSHVEPPTWRCQPPQSFKAEECIAVKNQIVHLPSIAAQKPVYSCQATPSFFTTNACNFEFDLDAPPPANWIKFLDTLWGDDQQSIQSLQEWFGYLLTADTREQKMLMIIGPKRSGKGTIARVLGELIGKTNLAAPTLGSLTTKFGLQPLASKNVAIISDARLSGRADQAVAVERLL